MTDNEATLTQRATDGVRTVMGVGGLIAVVLGLFVLFAPGTSAKVATGVVAVILALYAIITGIVYLGSAIFSRTIGGWARIGHILLGLLYLAAGIIMMSNLLVSGAIVVLFLTIMIGVLWLFEGIMAFALMREARSKTWNAIYGVISILAAITLMFSPMLGAATLWLLLGISMVVLGVAQIVRAFSITAAE